MTGLLLLSILIACPATASESAKAPTAQQRGKDSPGLQWVNAYIDMLALVRQSGHSTDPTPVESQDINSAKRSLLEQIVAGKKAILDLNEAKLLVSPFKKNKRQQISMAADINCTLLDAQINMYSKATKIALSVYNGKVPTDYADQISDLRAKTDSIWNHFLKIAAMSSAGAFLTPKDNSEHYDTLDFSEEQRDKLLRRMEDYFGQAVKDSSNINGRSSVELAPAFFYRGLAGKNPGLTEQPSRAAGVVADPNMPNPTLDRPAAR